jgi:hypothetical protein
MSDTSDIAPWDGPEFDAEPEATEDDPFVVGAIYVDASDQRFLIVEVVDTDLGKFVHLSPLPAAKVLSVEFMKGGN